jgi:hypothetical protein
MVSPLGVITFLTISSDSMGNLWHLTNFLRPDSRFVREADTPSSAPECIDVEVYMLVEPPTRSRKLEVA